MVVVEWGAGKLDGVSKSWLSVDIVRPVGAATAEELDADQPRTVVITGTGPRGLELEAAMRAGE